MASYRGTIILKFIGLIILAVILYHVDLNSVWDQLKASNPFAVAMAIILIFPQVAVRVYRWQYMLQRGDIRCSFKLATTFYFAGIYFGLMTPGRLGELAKAFLLKNRNLGDFGHSLPSIIVDRFLDLYFLIIIALFALAFLEFEGPVRWVGVLFALVASSAPWFAKMVWRSGHLTDWLVKRIVARHDVKWRASFTTFNETLGRIVSAPLSKLVGLTALSYSIYFVQTWLIGKAIGLHLDYVSIAMVVSLSILIGYIPITIAGLGTREAVLLYMFEKFSVSSTSTLSFAFIYNLVYIVFMGGIAAIFWLTIHPADKRSIKP